VAVFPRFTAVSTISLILLNRSRFEIDLTISRISVLFVSPITPAVSELMINVSGNLDESAF